jgi:hypothetical protein
MPSSHSGTVAMSSAANPDGTVFSPMPTAPLATSSSTPTIAQPRHSAQLGHGDPVPPGGGPAPRVTASPLLSDILPTGGGGNGGQAGGDGGLGGCG